MSTNYYVRDDEHATEPDGLHIGQHAKGNEFLFRAHPDLELTDCDAWRAYLDRPDVVIVAEYGVEVPLDQFWPHATARPAHVGGPNVMRSRQESAPRPNYSRDRHGHPFHDGFFC